MPGSGDASLPAADEGDRRGWLAHPLDDLTLQEPALLSQALWRQTDSLGIRQIFGDGLA